MSEHYSSSSLEETSSEHDSASNTSYDEDGEPVPISHPIHHLKELWARPRAAADTTSSIFPFSLLSACSGRERANGMCHYARSLTSQNTESSAKAKIGMLGKLIGGG
jgi:hypothetical protein